MEVFRLVSPWRKSSYSGLQENCLEVAVIADSGRLVRDSKYAGGPVLRFSGSEWLAFLAGIKQEHLA